jgi:hypothetical protein
MPGNGHVRFGGRPGRKRTSTAGTSPPGPPYLAYDLALALALALALQ